MDLCVMVVGDGLGRCSLLWRARLWRARLLVFIGS